MSPARSGAAPQLRAATDPDAKGGEFYGPRWVNNGPPVRKPIFRRVGMDRAIERLWEVSERETGLKLEVDTRGAVAGREPWRHGARSGGGGAAGAARARRPATASTARR